MAAGKNYRVFLEFLNAFMKSGKLQGVLEFTCPEIEELKRQHKALLAIERAKAFEEAALIVDKRETNGATAHILLRKAIEAREGK